MLKAFKAALAALLFVGSRAQIASNYYANNFNNAAAAQLSQGNTIASQQALGGLGLWGGPVGASNYYENNYLNAAAAQMSSGNTIASQQFAAPLGLGYGYGYPYGGIPYGGLGLGGIGGCALPVGGLGGLGGIGGGLGCFPTTLPATTPLPVNAFPATTLPATTLPVATLPETVAAKSN